MADSNNNHICVQCGKSLAQATRGRAKSYCSDACRNRAFRCTKTGKKPNSGLNHETPNFVASEGIENIQENMAENEGVYPLETPLRKFQWQHVNEVTWKLHNGEKSRTAAVHGLWASFETYLALAWVIDVGWGDANPSRQRWLARWRDRSYGPVTLAEAKRAALALVIGGFEEPVDVVRDPIERLNRLSASEQVVDHENGATSVGASWARNSRDIRDIRPPAPGTEIEMPDLPAFLKRI